MRLERERATASDDDESYVPLEASIDPEEIDEQEAMHVETSNRAVEPKSLDAMSVASVMLHSSTSIDVPTPPSGTPQADRMMRREPFKLILRNSTTNPSRTTLPSSAWTICLKGYCATTNT